MTEARKISVHWTCAECRKTDFGMALRSDHMGANRPMEWLQLPPGWWAFPIDFGDSDGEEASTMMLHAFCSERCVNGAIARTRGEVQPKNSTPAPEVVRGVTRGRITPRRDDHESGHMTSTPSKSAHTGGIPLTATLAERLKPLRKS